MKAANSDIFQTTMLGLETGLHVLHITTFGLQSCASDADVTAVLSDPTLQGFDQIPVRKNGRIIGVIERTSRPASGRAEQRMRSLDDSILLSAQTPLPQFIPLMVEAPYRLVLGGKEGHGVHGIVTRSDLLKLPVRLFAFALVTHLELLMSEIIQIRFPETDVWRTSLSPGRQTKLDEKAKNLQQRNFNPPLLELTELSDKRTILKKHLNLGKDFANDLEEIEDVRNKVAHAANYAGSETEILQFIARLSSAQRWIGYLTVNYLRQEERKSVPPTNEEKGEQSSFC